MTGFILRPIRLNIRASLRHFRKRFLNHLRVPSTLTVQRKQPSFRAVYRNLGAGRRFKPHLRLVENDATPAEKKRKLVQPRLPVAHEPSPEQELRITRTEALEMFEPLPLPTTWTIYATAPIGEVAANIAGLGKILRAAMLLHELGTAHIAQRRTEHGTDYLIRSTFKPA